MRKSVKRSIIVWPAAAAALVTVASAAATHLQIRPSSRGTVETTTDAKNHLSQLMRRTGFSGWLEKRYDGNAVETFNGIVRPDGLLSDRVDASSSVQFGSLSSPADGSVVANRRQWADQKWTFARPADILPPPKTLDSNAFLALSKVLDLWSDQVSAAKAMVATGQSPTEMLFGQTAEVNREPSHWIDLLTEYPIYGNSPTSNFVEQSSDANLSDPISGATHGHYNLTQVATSLIPKVAVRPNRKSSAGSLLQPRLFPGNRVLSKPVLTIPAIESSSIAVVAKPQSASAPVRAPRRSISRNVEAWPSTPSLQRLLREMTSLNPSADQSAITDSITSELNQLRSIYPLSDRRAAEPLAELARLARESILVGESSIDRDEQIAWLCMGHAVARRADTWAAIHDIVSHPYSLLSETPNSLLSETPIPEASTDASITRGDVAAAVQVLHRDLDQTGDVDGWREYLLLDEIEAALQDPSAERLALAQSFLSRLHYHSIDADAREFVSRRSVQQLAQFIRPWAGGAVDYAKLMMQIESLESDPTDLASMELADAIATLSHTRSPAVGKLAEVMTTHYQNANVRIAISEELINRLLPEIQPQVKPIRTRVLGSQVRGVSTVRGNLKVRLKPSTDQWLLSLQTLGDIQSRTTGSRDGVSVLTSGNNEFLAEKIVKIDSNGLVANETDVAVTGQAKLRGVRSQYDAWPLLGPLVREIAKSKFEESRSAANRIAAAQIRSEVSREMDGRVEEQSEAATKLLTDVLLGPMSRMQLDPQVMQMETTEKRLVARYRVAGSWQLAAFTPRIRAYNDSLMSVQVHQSMLNNTLEQLIARDEPMTIEDLLQRSAGVFGSSIAAPEDVPQDVTIQFTDSRPITIEIEDDRLWVTMRIDSLRKGGDASLRSFLVRAAYKARTDGLTAELVRDGHLSISGPGMSMRQRLPIRLVFNKVLSDDRPIRLTLPTLADLPAAAGLAITQCELRDGWIGIAIGPHRPERVATR